MVMPGRGSLTKPFAANALNKALKGVSFAMHLKQDGVMAIILPHGVLCRGGAEARMRTKLLQDGHIDTVIGLPANLFYSTGIPVCIVVLKRCKKPDDVLFINAAAILRRESARISFWKSTLRRSSPPTSVAARSRVTHAVCRWKRLRETNSTSISLATSAQPMRKKRSTFAPSTTSWCRWNGRLGWPLRSIMCFLRNWDCRCCRNGRRAASDASPLSSPSHSWMVSAMSEIGL